MEKLLINMIVGGFLAFLTWLIFGDHKKKPPKPKESDKEKFEAAKNLVIHLYKTGQIKEMPADKDMIDYWNKLKDSSKKP